MAVNTVAYLVGSAPLSRSSRSPTAATATGTDRMGEQPVNTSSATHPDTRHDFNRHCSNLIRKAPTRRDSGADHIC